LRRPFSAAASLLATGLVALAIAPGSPGATSGDVPNPTVTGPIEGGIHGYPWNHSLYGLHGRGFDYTEREYFFGGQATDLGTGASAPYESRMLVRLPRDRSDFSGAVLVEWLNVTNQADLETAWPVEARYLMRHGIGYIGVSAQLAGVCCGPTTLKGWDPRRYAALVHPGDPFSYDVFSQAIQALRDPSHNGTSNLVPTPVDPMRHMRARKVIVTGASQSAFYLTSFVNDGYNRGQIDAYVITRGGGPFEDFSTPIFQLNEENTEAPQPDNRRYVAWEEAGAAHAPAVWWGYISREQQRDLTTPGTPDVIDTACSVNHGSVDYSSRALSKGVTRYLNTGELPPSAPRVKRTASGEIVRDANGLAEGGVRHVFVQVPVGYNSSEGCPLFGTYRAWSAGKIKSLYRTHSIYVRKVRRWSAHEVRRGWLIRPDRRDVIRKARRFVAPWTGECSETCRAPLGL
jgi:hypothetical protein